MKALKFKNGNTVNFTDGSTLGSLVIIVSSFADLDAIKKDFETPDNLIGGSFDGKTIAQTLYTGVSASAEDTGNIIATFTTREFTHDEITDSRIADLEDAVASM